MSREFLTKTSSMFAQTWVVQDLTIIPCWVLVAHSCNPTAWEAEIRRIVVQGQPGKIVWETLSPK
jgi:hypothetical protein